MKSNRWLIGVAPIIAMTLAATAVPVTAAAEDVRSHLSSSEQSALSSLRAALAEAGAAGSKVAATNLIAFDSLTSAQSLGLARYLTGKSGITAAGPSPAATTRVVGGITVSTDGDARWVSESRVAVPKDLHRAEAAKARATFAPAAVTYGVHSYTNESFAIAGITLSTTRVWADYVTGSGVVQRIRDYGCQLIFNFEPSAEITTTKQSQSLSGGKATFKCLVTVKRGIPTPWGQITTSTRQGYQYMSVNGRGVYSHGWQ